MAREHMKSRTTSVRAEPALIADFQRAMEARGTNQNKAILAFMRGEVEAFKAGGASGSQGYAPKSSPTRSRVLELFAEGENKRMSPKAISVALKMPVPRVSYHIRRMAEDGVLVLVGVEERRGALEHFYVAAEGALLAHESADEDLAAAA